MSESKHTPGEWEAHGTMVVTPPRSERDAKIKAGEPFTSRRICLTDNEFYIGKDQAEANAKRIAACVNALAGLNPEGVRDVVEACESVLSAFADCRRGMWRADIEAAFDECRAALSKVKQQEAGE